MKKLLLTVMSLILVSAAFTSCGADEAGSDMENAVSSSESRRDSSSEKDKDESSEKYQSNSDKSDDTDETSTVGDLVDSVVDDLKSAGKKLR